MTELIILFSLPILPVLAVSIWASIKIAKQNRDHKAWIKAQRDSMAEINSYVDSVLKGVK